MPTIDPSHAAEADRGHNFANALADTLIVIPCLDEEAHLPALLAQIVAQSGGALIVVADGGSRDRSRAIVQEWIDREPNVRLIDNAARLQSAGLNLAARRFGAGRKWLVRIDAHCLYPDDYAAGLLAAARRTAATSVVVPMVTRGERCFQIGVAAAQNSVLGTGGSPHRHVGEGRFVDHGHHALMRLQNYLDVGGYDETFSHNEDAELDQRLLAAGARIWLEPSLALTYFPRGAPLPLFRQYRGYGGGRARTTARHAARLKLRQLGPIAIAPILLLASAGLTGSIWAPPLAIAALPMIGWLMACLCYGLSLGVRDKSSCKASAGLAAIVMHSAWSWGYWREQARLGKVGPGPEPIIPDEPA